MTAPESRHRTSPDPISDQTWEAVRAEFTLPSRELGGARPVDLLKDSRAPLRRALEAFGAS